MPSSTKSNPGDEDWSSDDTFDRSSLIGIENEADTDSDQEGPIRELGDIRTQSKRFPFPMNSQYTSLQAWEAFRELVQNWQVRDAIIESFQLDEKIFRTLINYEDNSRGRTTDILYKVLDPDTKNSEPKAWLGYIRYKGTNGMGEVDVVNAQATLQPWHLKLGGTSKKHSAQQAGSHGEGFKLAILVMMRGPNHSVICHSGNFKWTFNFNENGDFYARLARLTPNQQKAQRELSKKEREKGLIPFVVSAKDDVKFTIGKTGQGRNGNGYQVSRGKVSLAEFREWTKAALFLENIDEEEVITTRRGDLIMTERLRGNIYLKGLLLKESRGATSASISGKALKYGYNFAHGQTDRDRHSVSTANEESNALLLIWDCVVTQCRPSLASELSDMLNNSHDGYAEVAGAVIILRSKLLFV